MCHELSREFSLSLNSRMECIYTYTLSLQWENERGKKKKWPLKNVLISKKRSFNMRKVCQCVPSREVPSSVLFLFFPLILLLGLSFFFFSIDEREYPGWEPAREKEKTVYESKKKIEGRCQLYIVDAFVIYRRILIKANDKVHAREDESLEKWQDIVVSCCSMYIHKYICTYIHQCHYYIGRWVLKTMVLYIISHK